jgi:hypothetical protein
MTPEMTREITAEISRDLIGIGGMRASLLLPGPAMSRPEVS